MSIDLSRPQNRAAFAREFVRRYGSPNEEVSPTPHGLTGPRAGYLPDGRPDRSHPVTARIDQGLADLLSLPRGPTRSKAEVEVFRQAVAARHWEAWTRMLAPSFVSSEFADAHFEMWRWWRGIERDRPTPPLAAAMFRGGAKSATTVLMTAGIAMGQLRDYALYVHAVKDKAQDEVGAIAELLQADIVQRAFPKVGSVYVTRAGKERDNRVERFRNQANFAIDAVGMDQALRGRRMDEDRPGWIVLDDLEDHQDSTQITKKKQDRVASTIIPSGSPDVAIVFAQNLIHPDSMMTKIAAGSGEVMASRVMVGPVPAVEGLEYSERSNAEIDELEAEIGERRPWKVTGGEPTWSRYGLDEVERELNLMGPAAFEREKQHNFDVVDGDMFPSDRWHIVEASQVPPLKLMARAWDVAASEKMTADWSVGTIGGVDARGDLYLLDQFRDQLEVAELEEKVRQLHDEAREHYRRQVPTLIEKQIGAAQKLYEIRWEPLMGSRVWHYVDPIGSKPDRADGLAGKQQRQRVFLMRGPWNAAFIREAALFPKLAKNDDQVDSAVHLHNWLMTEISKQAKSRGSVSTRAGKTSRR